VNNNMVFEESKMGVYEILNILDSKMYIGSSVDLPKRKRDHLRELKNNIHTNGRLQNAFNKYGLKNFVFSILEFVSDRESLLEREQYWIDKMDSSNRNVGYNINRLATGGGNYVKDNGNYGVRGSRNPLSKSIAQIDLKSRKVIKIWGSSMDITRELGFHNGNICQMCILAREEMVLRFSNGYYWCYEEDIDNIHKMNIYIHKKRPLKTSRDYSDIEGDKNPRARKIVQLTLDGDYVTTFNTVKSAAESTGVRVGNIYTHLSNDGKNCGGYKWRYLEDYEQQSSIL